MLFRVRREIFRLGEFEQHVVTTPSTKVDLCEAYHIDPSCVKFYGQSGVELDIDDDVVITDEYVTAIQFPADPGSIALATLIVLGTIVGGYFAGAALGWWPNIFEQKTNKLAKMSYAYSLRGSNNPRRKGGNIGILLGKCNITPDMAGMVYSSYSDGYQYLHQLFGYGYSDVRVCTDSSYVKAGSNPNGYIVRVGETPIDMYSKDLKVEINNHDENHIIPISNFSYYNTRCIEEGVSIKLAGPDEADIYMSTSASNTVKIGVGICAPYGWNTINSDGDTSPLNMHYKIEYRVHGGSTWYPLAEVNRSVFKEGTDYYRAMHEVVVDRGQYDIRVWRVDHDSDEPGVNDTLMVELVQYYTCNPLNGSVAPVTNSERFGLMGVKVRATDKLNGYLDSVNMECFLNCHYYTGTVPSDNYALWVKDTNPTTVGDRNNPACALLYMLTNPNVNPRALDMSDANDRARIDWYSLSEWFLFCKSMTDPNVVGDDGWKCNAWITEPMTVGEICENICLSGRARLRIVDGKYTVLIEQPIRHVTQMFTPRNAWGMQETRSFEKSPTIGKASFVEEDTGEEVERYAQIVENESGEAVITYPDDISEADPSLQQESYTLWGVTKPHQVAQLIGYQLLCKRLQTRTYTWNCALESITCAVGDVVYLANDMFLHGLSYGRITEIIEDSLDSSKIAGVVLDESIGIDTTKRYGMIIRTASAAEGIGSSFEINQNISNSYEAMFTASVKKSDYDIAVGDLFIYGDYEAEGKKVVITGITPDKDKSASITAVDYDPGVFVSVDQGEIPPYTSGISVYGSGVNTSKGVVRPVYTEIGTAGAPGPQGEPGAPGTTFTPSVSEEGVISWTNDGGQENPPAVSIKGSTGNGIASITYQYATSQTQTGVKTPYQPTIPTLSEIDKYLWQKETITYTEGSPKVEEALIGVYGDKGAPGSDAPNVKFQYSDNGTTWSDTPSSSTQYMRSSNDNGLTWSNSYKVKGETGPQGVSNITIKTTYTGTKATLDNWAINSATDTWNYTNLTSNYSNVKVGDLVWFVCTCKESSSPYNNKKASIPRIVSAIASSSFRTSSSGLSAQWEALDGATGESITTTFEYAMTTSSSVTPSTWYETRPSGWVTGYCYWYREKFTDESGNTSYSSPVVDVAYNSMMEGFVIFEVKANPSSFKRNLRTANDQTITINVRKDYIPGNCTITARTEDSVSIPVTTVIVNERYTITVNDVNDFDKITITGIVSGRDPQEVILNVVDETEYNRNFGSVTALPSETTINGDYFFAETSIGDYPAGFPYVKEGGSWTQLAGTSPENAQRLLGVLGTVLNDKQTPASLSAVYGWFENLAAQSAVIKSLFSEAITIRHPGHIKSDNFAETGGFVTQGFKLNSSGLGQFGEGTQLGNVDIRINDTVSGTPVQLLTTSKYAEGGTYSIPAKSRWSTSAFFKANSYYWSYCREPYTDTPNITYNGSNYYRFRSYIDFKPGETSDYVLKFDKACTATLTFKGDAMECGRYLADLIIDGNNYSYYIRYDISDIRGTVTYTKTVAAGETITVNTRNFPYKPNNNGTKNNDGVSHMGSVVMTISGSLATICDKRVRGYSNSSTQTLPTAGTYNFTIFPQNTFIQNSFSFTHAYSGGGTVYSSDFIDYTNVSPLASINEGNYNCVNSSVGGYTITALSRSGSTIYLHTSNGNTIEYLLEPDTSEFATSGWYDTSGSVTLVGSQSSLITYNINASDPSADIGAIQPYNSIHANHFYGHVNGNDSSAYPGDYKVWHAVFN